ncbi:cell division protein ZapA [Tsuneonella sp. HG094]|jgi:cell division protein ZapA
MSEVALSIGGRTYRVACAPGEEARVTRLGETVAEKLAALGNPAGPDAQNLLFAALLLADEVQEGRETVAGAQDKIASSLGPLQSRIAELEGELAELQGARDGEGAELAHALDRLAEMESALAAQEAKSRELHDELAAAREQLSSRPVAIAAPDTPADLSALAPALEHFAEMLEECADKLEGRAASA